MAYGKVIQIIGPVIDCEFGKSEIPKINEAIRILRNSTPLPTDAVITDQAVVESDNDVYAEVLQQRGSGVVRCVSFNATDNAEEMMKKLELMSNRARQAKITTELTEIVNGAQQAEKM